MRYRPTLVSLLISCAMLTALASAPRLARAGGFNNPDMGPRRDGMFAITARPDDTTAILHNPAGLADQRGDRVILSTMSAFVQLSIEARCEPWMLPYDNLGECAGREYTPAFGPERSFGLSPFVGGSLDLARWVPGLVVGVAAYAPNFLGAFMAEDSLARFFGIENYFATALATGAVAWRPLPQLAVGVGLSYMYVAFQSWRRLDLAIDEFNLKINGAEHSGQANLGLLLNPTSWLALGAGFETQANLVIEGDVKVANSYDEPDDPFLTLRHRSRLVVPWKLKLGVNVQATDWLELGVDYFFWRYSAFAVQSTDIIVPPGTDPALAQLVAGLDLSQPKHLRDSHNLCAGLRVTVPGAPLPLWVMAGGQYDWSPGNERYFTLDSPYTDIYGLALGFDSQPLPWLRAGVAWIHNRFRPLDIRDSLTVPPGNVRFKAYNNELSVALQLLL